jgi:hypothetical protein
MRPGTGPAEHDRTAAMAKPTLQDQARALGDPTRHAIFLAGASADRLGIAELLERFAFNHNAIRQHLA